MSVGRVTFGMAAAVAALAFGQAGASEPPDVSTEAPVEEGKPGEASDAQQRGSVPSGMTRTSVTEEGTGAGEGDASRARDRREREPRDGVSYPLPDQDPELQKLLSE